MTSTFILDVPYTIQRSDSIAAVRDVIAQFTQVIQDCIYFFRFLALALASRTSPGLPAITVTYDADTNMVTFTLGEVTASFPGNRAVDAGLISADQLDNLASETADSSIWGESTDASMASWLLNFTAPKTNFISRLVRSASSAFYSKHPPETISIIHFNNLSLAVLRAFRHDLEMCEIFRDTTIVFSETPALPADFKNAVITEIKDKFAAIAYSVGSALNEVDPTNPHAPASGNTARKPFDVVSDVCTYGAVTASLFGLAFTAAKAYTK